MARTGRRPGNTESREHILEAARQLFAELGYDRTTVRAIAAHAEVNAALVHHFFGNKQQLFVAAMELPVNPAELVPEVVAAAPDEVGDRLARMFLALWGVPQQRAPFLAILRSVANNEQAATMMREFMDHAVLAHIATTLGIPKIKVSMAAAQVIGLVLMRYVVEIPTLTEATDEEIVQLIGPTIQRYLTE